MRNLEYPVGYTTKSQSERLLKCGLDKNSADMYYLDLDDIPHVAVHDLDDDDIPCWTVGKLISMMPKSISDPIEGSQLLSIEVYENAYSVRYGNYYQGGSSELIECIIAFMEFREKEKRVLLVSQIRTPDGTVLTSRFVHDYAEHRDANGELYFIDGGNMYQNTSWNKIPFTDISIYTDSPFEEIRENFMRGTFDKNGNRLWKPICECTDKHLENILIYNKEHCPNTPQWYNDIIIKEQEYRKEHGIVIEDTEYEQMHESHGNK